MPEKLVPLMLKGQRVEVAVVPDDFFRRKLHRTEDGEMVTYAEAGYALGDRYEDLTEYDGPKTQRQYDRAQEEKQAAKATDEKPAPKAEAKKD
jgi:hypothetical protein